MELSPAAVRPASPEVVPAPPTPPAGPVRIQVSTVALVGFSPRDQVAVVEAFRDELARVTVGPVNPASSESMGKVTVEESRAENIGRAAARELAKRLQ